MGYDLFIRKDKTLSELSKIEFIHPLLQSQGLRYTSNSQWIFDSAGCWMEVYLSFTAEGTSSEDDDQTDATHFSQVDCHPKPLNLPSAMIIHAIAAHLGWEIFDPQTGELWREAGPFSLLSTLEPAAITEAKAVASDAWQETGCTLAEVDKDEWLVGYKGQYISSPQGVDIRSGIDLVRTSSLTNAGPPAAVSSDRTWIATAYPRNTPENPYKEYGAYLQTIKRDTSEAKIWPTRNCFAWLPDSPTTLLAVTRYDKAKDPFELPAELAVWEQGGTRLLIIDVESNQLHSLRPDEILGDESHGHGGEKLVIGGDGEIACFATKYCIHAFSLTSGKMIWRHWVENAYFHAVAASHCGRLLAVAGLGHGSLANALQIYHAHSGRLELALSKAALGTSSAVYSLAFHSSGWLAAGLGNGSVVHIYLNGTATTYACLKGSVQTLAFNSEGTQLFVAGVHKGITCITVPPANNPIRAPINPNRRMELIRSWDFANHEPVLSNDPIEILSFPFYQASERLMALDNADKILESLLSTQAVNDRYKLWSIVLAAAGRASMQKRLLPELYYQHVSQMAAFSPKAWHIHLQQVLKVIPPHKHTQLLLAKTIVPAWGLFQLLPASEIAEYVINMINSWPRGIYTQLKKKHAALDFIFGYNSHEFWEQARNLLLYLGEHAVPHIEYALQGKTPHAKLYTDVLQVLRIESSKGPTAGADCP